MIAIRKPGDRVLPGGNSNKWTKLGQISNHNICTFFSHSIRMREKNIIFDEKKINKNNF